MIVPKNSLTGDFMQLNIKLGQQTAFTTPAFGRPTPAYR